MSAAELGPWPARAFAAAIVHLRWLIVVAWIAGAAYATVALPSIQSSQGGTLGALVPRGAPALKAEAASAKLFGFPVLSRALVVQRDPRGLSAAAQARVVARVTKLDRHAYPDLRRIAGAYPLINTLGKPPFSREHSTTAITYLLFGPSVNEADRTKLAERFAREHVDRPGDGLVGVTGLGPAGEAQQNAITGHLTLVSGATVALVLLAVGLVFRALGAPLANLLAVGVAYLVSIRLVALLGRDLGVSVPQEVEPVIVVLVFGIMTDYSVFFLSRFRERLAMGEDSRLAARRATVEVAPIVLVCGLTVALANAALVIGRLGFFQAFGPGMALAVLVSLAVALTLVPALLACFGARLFWPRVAASTQAARGPRRPGRVIRTVVRFPLPVALTCLVLIGLAISGLRNTHLGDATIRGLPASSGPRRAYDAATKGFAPGVLGPTVIVLEQAGIAHQRRALARVQQGLAAQPGVAAVIGPADSPVSRARGAVLASSGDAARYVLFLNANPTDSRAINDLQRISARLPALLTGAGVGHTRSLIGGDTALTQQTISATEHDLARVLAAALLVILVILIAYLRGIVAPLYLVFAGLLGPAAALGAATYLFHDLTSYKDLTYFVPIATGVLLVSLGSDYNVFLAGRIWEEARRRSAREAVLVGGGTAAGAISYAGLIFAGSFALLALVPLREFREVAATMVIGLLVDAFIVRGLLVPAVLTLRARAPSRSPGRAVRVPPVNRG
ncbi:MAG: MMPL family transporter [Solirubrobacteraceae bacterium]